jgi:hypothetical protein
MSGLGRVTKSFYRIVMRAAKLHDAHPALKGLVVTQRFPPAHCSPRARLQFRARGIVHFAFGVVWQSVLYTLPLELYAQICSRTGANILFV